ncbi:hypothetical protein LCGC14_1201270 [marine sediment metagenome]|uniref:ERCC4 domain-containing protein n=1 Tax=marine sediment metagenome TaxID=412755 RepID=A0A0F9LL80_9ZZZZ
MLEIDNHEPSQLIELLGQTTPTQVSALNSAGYADFKWWDGDQDKQIERKTWNDLLADLGSIETQLMRQMDNHPECTLALLIEGIAVPGKGITGGTAVLRQTKGTKGLYYQSHQSKVNMQAIYAWIYQVSKYMEVYQTPDLYSTAKAITAFYSSDQKEGHTTFNRHLKEKTFHPNPQVTSLMGMVPGIGPVKAEALIGKFGTVWEILNSTPDRLAVVHGVGVKETTRWLRLIGRPDV